jgi:hypothetical protein
MHLPHFGAVLKNSKKPGQKDLTMRRSQRIRHIAPGYGKPEFDPNFRRFDPIRSWVASC